MSDKTPSDLKIETTLQGELTQEEQSALHQGLTDLPAPSTRPDFNRSLLAALTSGRDFAPWWRQALTRAGWMFLPAILGCVVGVGLIHAWMPSRIRQMPILPSPPRHTGMVPGMPALDGLPMPSQTLPASEETLPREWLPKDTARPVGATVLSTSRPAPTMSVGPTSASPVKATPSPAGAQERR
jgi:hypothetical protein